MDTKPFPHVITYTQIVITTTATMIPNYYSTDSKSKHTNISLFPAILDATPFTRNPHPHTESSDQEPSQQQHRRSSLFSRRSSKSSTSSTSNPGSPRRHSHSAEATTPKPSEEEHQLQRRHTFRRKLSLPHPHLGALATKFLAPTTYLSVSPTHERAPEFDESAEPQRPSLKGKEKAKEGSVKADEVQLEEDGGPLCREAEIETWKRTSGEVGPEARWALYW